MTTLRLRCSPDFVPDPAHLTFAEKLAWIVYGECRVELVGECLCAYARIPPSYATQQQVWIHMDLVIDLKDGVRILKDRRGILHTYRRSLANPNGTMIDWPWPDDALEVIERMAFELHQKGEIQL